MRPVIFCLVLAAIVACNKPSPAGNNSKLDQLADRTCRAMHIRQQRYALADKIRFADDTLGVVKDEKTRVRLQNSMKIYLIQKDSLLKLSLALADTIQRQLDSLTPYTNKDARKQFNADLNRLLAKKGCPVTTGKDSVSAN
ncbi:MAG: hypothetical protein JST19_05320 [Bacteroidetes bacterium]|nr:hypothetical protein [Bacteroidota bacterium]